MSTATVMSCQSMGASSSTTRLVNGTLGLRLPRRHPVADAGARRCYFFHISDISMTSELPSGIEMPW